MSVKTKPRPVVDWTDDPRINPNTVPGHLNHIKTLYKSLHKLDPKAFQEFEEFRENYLENC